MAYNVAAEMAKQVTITLYKEAKESKLGVTFFRRDPQEGASPESAIISRIGSNGAASGKLEMGERILKVNGTIVEGPLHAARLLRESEGYLKIGKLPKRADFDANLPRYQELEAQAAREAMAAALPGQQPQSTPRTDAATPRGPGASAVPSQYSSGLRPLNQGGEQPGLQLNVASIGDGIQQAGGQLSARAIEAMGGLGENLGQLSARAGKWFEKVGNDINRAAELIPTQQNRERWAARTIQKRWRAYAARGHFHEERGAVLMLQSAARRKSAVAVRKYKETLVNWAAIVIQEAWKRHQLRVKSKELEKNGGDGGSSHRGNSKSIGSRLVKSLSFTRRTTKSKHPRPAPPVEATAEDLKAIDIGSHKPHLGGPVPEPTGAKRRSLSFTRRKKKEAGSDGDHAKQTV